MKFLMLSATACLGLSIMLFGVGYMVPSASAAGGANGKSAGPMSMLKMREMAEKYEKLSPTAGYLAAHDHLEHPYPLLGGPIRVTVSQSQGDVHVALPARRKLDPDVFGTPALPRAYGGLPIVEGVPPELRGTRFGRYTKLKLKTPFGDKMLTLKDGRLRVVATNRTATDAATTKDSVHMQASWKNSKGNTYSVRCCSQMFAHGKYYPTFGGVVTNTILHGFTRIGTPLMPSEFAYMAFWGKGKVYKNGKVVAGPRLIHGMLTEYVRPRYPKLAFDRDVDPEKIEFHLIVPAVLRYGRLVMVHTGFKLPNGKQLLFWHVMFHNIKVSSKRLPVTGQKHMENAAGHSTAMTADASATRTAK